MKKMRGVLALAGAALLAGALLTLRPAASEVNQVTRLAPGVFFHEGDLKGQGHCNNGWIELEDFVLVVDANFPSGADLVIPKIKETTRKPIRFVFDTHHHGDHAYGNQVWVNHGAAPVANRGVLLEMEKYEPKRWDDTAKTRKDVAASRLKRPTLLFPQELVFDDGKRRLELLHFGVAHTRGDGFAWLPEERILFTGDACVNGPYNYVGDGNIKQWIKTLENARMLQPKTVAPGHGPVAGGELLEDQRLYFAALLSEATNLLKKYPSPVEAAAHLDEPKNAILASARIKKYIGDMYRAQIEKAYVEVGGKPFPQSSLNAGGDRHAAAHGLERLRTTPPMKWNKRMARGK